MRRFRNCISRRRRTISEESLNVGVFRDKWRSITVKWTNRHSGRYAWMPGCVIFLNSGPALSTLLERLKSEKIHYSLTEMKSLHCSGVLDVGRKLCYDLFSHAAAKMLTNNDDDDDDDNNNNNNRPGLCLWCWRHDSVIAWVHPVHAMNAEQHQTAN